MNCLICHTFCLRENKKSFEKHKLQIWSKSSVCIVFKDVSHRAASASLSLCWRPHEEVRVVVKKWECFWGESMTSVQVWRLQGFPAVSLAKMTVVTQRWATCCCCDRGSKAYRSPADHSVVGTCYTLLYSQKHRELGGLTQQHTATRLPLENRENILGL